MKMKFKVGQVMHQVPDGIYRIIVRQIINSATYKRPCFVFNCEIAEGEHKGTVARAFCNADYDVFSNHTKLYQWYSIVAGENLETGDEIDLSAFYDKVLEVRIETKTSRKTNNNFSNVVEIIKVVMEV